MDDLRTRIWDYLYNCGRPEHVAIIAEQLQENPHTIRQTVEDPWFELDEHAGCVDIAKVKQ